MKIGVLMPCRTPVKYVKPAVESILNQSHKDFQFIVFDDDAPAETKEYLYEIKDPRLTVVTHTTPLGIGASMNEGLQMLKTELYCTMHADDIAHPQRLAQQVAYMQKHPHVGILGTQIKFIDQDGAPSSKRPNRVPLTHEELTYQLLWASAFNDPTTCGRRQMVLDRGGYSTFYKSAPDYELWTRLSPDVPFANLPERLLHYRVHPQQTHATRPENVKHVRDLRLAYRAKLSGLPVEACDDNANKKDWNTRLKFYTTIGERFTNSKSRRDLTRRLIREAKRDLKSGQSIPKKEILLLARQLHWPTALLAQLGGKL